MYKLAPSYAPLVKEATKAEGGTCSLRLPYASMTWLHDLAAFVQIVSEGNDKADGFFGDGMNGRWMRMWRW